MAWQLIYTSAPRLLEAGRSGFGTVARHREISPLLVSAVERVSQFSRQPGLDLGRVIFSHRVIPISGGRYHVLSCIHDAGADYTGRTTHMAHHVIVDSREIALAGAAAPTPAEILLGMAWRGVWEEPPRYLTEEDEIHLSHFHQQTGPQNAAWHHATGSPQHAWLLANGQGSRGAYVVTPATVDARWLFAESMRLAPERAWQFTCTTSFQPSDESSEFRWIGIEADSILRRSVENAGRVVFDLTQPATLPQPEIPYTAPAAPVADVSTPVRIESREVAPQDYRDASRVESARAPAESTVRAPRPVAPTPVTLSPREYGTIPVAKRRRRRFPVRELSISLVALIVVVAVGFGFLWPKYDDWRRAKALRAEIKSTLDGTNYFSKSQDALINVDDTALPVALGIAKAGAGAVAVVQRGQLSEMSGLRLDDGLQQKAQSGGMPGVPPEIKVLYQKIAAISTLHEELKTSGSTQERYKKLEELTEEIQKLAEGTPDPRIFAICQKRLQEMARGKQLAVLNELLMSATEPTFMEVKAQSKITWFDEKLKALDEGAGTPEQKVAIQKLKDVTSDWKSVEEHREGEFLGDVSSLARRKDDWPEWLKKKGENLGGTPRLLGTPATLDLPKVEVPQPKPPVASVSFPAIVVGGLAALEKQSLDFESGAKYYLQSAVDVVQQRLQETPGKLWLDVQAKPDFEFEAQGRAVFIKPVKVMNLPFALYARKPPETDLYAVWVVDPASPSKRRGRITREGNIGIIDPSLMPFRGVPRGLQLALPKNWPNPGANPTPLVVRDWQVDFSELRAALESRKANLEKAISASAETPAPARAEDDPTVAFATAKGRMKTIIETQVGAWFGKRSAEIRESKASRPDKEKNLRSLDAERKSKEEKIEKHLSDQGQPIYKQYAGCIMAASEAFNWDRLSKFGSALNDASPTGSTGAVTNARGELEAMKKAVPAADGAGLETIETLAKMGGVVAEMETSEKRGSQQQKKTKQVVALQDELERLTKHPLLSEKDLGGEYQLIIDGNPKIILMEITVE